MQPAAIFYKATCHIIHLSASKSKPAVKDNLDRLFSWVFKFYEPKVIMLQRFHGMNFARNKVLQENKGFMPFDPL